MIDPADARKFCREILPEVSRTFALAIPALPEGMADSVCCGYLLCRMADTIEDRPGLPPALRGALFDHYAALLDVPAGLPEFLSLWPAQNDAEGRLMEGLERVLTLYASLPSDHRDAIRSCVDEMVVGMRRFVGRPQVNGRLYVCSDLDDLEAYCHYVAGTVGIMLSRIFRRPDGYREQGRRFGLGLQMTNILQDHRTDLARGVSFLAPAWLDSGGDILPSAKGRLVLRALEHLEEAEEYTLAIPPAPPGVRLFCLWPLWMAASTLRETAVSDQERPKISRSEVEEIVRFTTAHVADDAALRKGYALRRKSAEEEARRLFPPDML